MYRHAFVPILPVHGQARVHAQNYSRAGRAATGSTAFTARPALYLSGGVGVRLRSMELRNNRIKHKLAAGGVATVVSGITHPDDIDAFGPIAEATGIDGVWLEGEHGAVDAADLGNLTRACDIWGLTSVVRVNDNHQGLIYRTLDRGAQAVVVPHVNTRAEADNVVAGGKFAPAGKRGMYTSRQYYGVDGYVHSGNDETCLIVLIEDIAAHANLDEILAVEHIDVFFVAPSDFAASMGRIGETGHPAVKEKIEDSIRRIVAAGKVAGTLTDNDDVADYVAMGVRFVLTATKGWLQAGAAGFAAAARGGS